MLVRIMLVHSKNVMFACIVLCTLCFHRLEMVERDSFNKFRRLKYRGVRNICLINNSSYNTVSQ